MTLSTIKTTQSRNERPALDGRNRIIVVGLGDGEPPPADIYPGSSIALSLSHVPAMRCSRKIFIISPAWGSNRMVLCTTINRAIFMIRDKIGGVIVGVAPGFTSNLYGQCANQRTLVILYPCALVQKFDTRIRTCCVDGRQLELRPVVGDVAVGVAKLVKCVLARLTRNGTGAPRTTAGIRFLEIANRRTGPGGLGNRLCFVPQRLPRTLLSPGKRILRTTPLVRNMRGCKKHQHLLPRDSMFNDGLLLHVRL